MPCWMKGSYSVEFSQASDRDALIAAITKLDMMQLGYTNPMQYRRLIEQTVDGILKAGKISFGDWTERSGLTPEQAAKEVKKEYARVVLEKTAKRFKLNLVQDKKNKDTYIGGMRK